MDDEGFKIEFFGDFCEDCGIASEYESVRYCLEEDGLNTAVTHVANVDDGFVADFTIVAS